MADGRAALPGVRAVVLTGSHAHGTPTEASDVELFVYADRDLVERRRVLVRLTEGLEDILRRPGSGSRPW